MPTILTGQFCRAETQETQVSPGGNPDKLELIMEAAERLFSWRRFHEITLDEVAREAGVGKGTIYLYFADKEDLFFQLATSGYTQLCEIIGQQSLDGQPFRESLLAIAAQISDFFERRRQLLRMMQTEDGRLSCHPGRLRERWLMHRQQLVGTLARVLQAGVAEGVIRADLPAEALAAFLLGLLRTRARESDVQEQLSLEQSIGLFLQGAAASGSEQGRRA